jgi:hypothetical protein
VLLTGCGTAATAVGAPPTATSSAFTVYTSQDVVAAWQQHGLSTSLTATDAPAGITSAWLLAGSAVGHTPTLLVLVAASPALAQSYAATASRGAYSERYVQANLVIAYRDVAALPYLLALSDLH